MIPKLFLSSLQTNLKMDIAIYCRRDINDISIPATFQARVNDVPFGNIYETESASFQRFTIPIQGPGKIELWGSINAVIKPFV